MAKKHMKRCSTPVTIREMQIKTTMSYHLKQVRMVIIKKSTSNRCWKGMEKRETFYTVDENENWQNCYGEQSGDILKKLKTELPYDLAIPLLG